MAPMRFTDDAQRRCMGVFCCVVYMQEAVADQGTVALGRGRTHARG